MHSYCEWIWRDLPWFWLSFPLHSKTAERTACAICRFTKHSLFPGRMLQLDGAAGKHERMMVTRGLVREGGTNVGTSVDTPEDPVCFHN